MTDPHKTEALLHTAAQGEARIKYEALLNEVLYEVHRVAEHSEQPWNVDDTKIHELIQRLRDEFEVSA